MALTVNTTYASGTVTSASGTNITLSGASADNTWVGRLFVLRRTINDRGGQLREIVEVNTPNSIEIEYPWRTSLDSSDPDFEFLPQSGDAFDISVTPSEIANGVDVIEVDPTLYKVEDDLTIDGNTTLYIKRQTIDFDNNLGEFRVTRNAGFCMGKYSASRLGVEGGTFLARSPSGQATTVFADVSNIGDAGDFFLYGSLVNVEAGITGNAYFSRIYRDSTQRIQIVDCQSIGEFGGRYEGDRARLRRILYFNSDSPIGPFTTRGSGIVVDNLTVSDSRQAMFWNFDPTFSGSGEVVSIRAQRIRNQLIRAGGTGNPGGTLDLTDWDISDWDLDGNEPNFADWPNDYDNSLINWNRTLSLSSATGGGRIAIFNNQDTEVYNELSADGSYPTVKLTERFFVGKNNGVSTFSEGTQRGPFTAKLRQFGFISLVQPFAALEPQTFEWFKTSDAFITSPDAATALAVTNPTTTEEAYEHIKATYEQETNMQYNELVSASGVTLTFDTDVVIDSALNSVQYDFPNEKISYSALNSGTTLTTLQLGVNKTLTLEQSGTQTAIWEIPTSGTINVVGGTTDLRAFGFVFGSTINNISAQDAIVIVSINPSNITATSTGGGDITVQEAPKVISIIGFPVGSTVITSQAGIELDVTNSASSPYTYTTGSQGESGSVYQFKVIAVGKKDFITSLNITETLVVQYLGEDEVNEQVLDKTLLDFQELMGKDAVFSRIASGDNTLQMQLWENPNWQSEWNTTVVADSPSTSEITTWIGYLNFTGYNRISFNNTTGEVN